MGHLLLDGHMDFADYSAYSGSLSGATHVRRSVELPGMSQRNMAFVGMSLPGSTEQYDRIKALGGVIFSADAIHKLGAAEVAQRACEHVMSECDCFYMTVDVDIVDPGYMPGTGAMDPSAITPTQLRDMLKVIASYPLDACDIAEIAPRLDTTGRSASLAAELALTIALTKLSYVPADRHKVSVSSGRALGSK
jgi:arginase family enzyme